MRVSTVTDISTKRTIERAINSQKIAIGDSFIYKGRYCTVTRMRGDGLYYDIQNSEIGQPSDGFMTYDFYMQTPSYKARYVRRSLTFSKKSS